VAKRASRKPAERLGLATVNGQRLIGARAWKTPATDLLKGYEKTVVRDIMD
jgi:hypothetical protein